MFLLSCFIFFFSIQGFLSSQRDYYWREYTGIIPDDAIVGGQDINEKDIYIGQALVYHAGLIVSQIYPGKREVAAPHGGVHKVSNYIKILCGYQDNFYWLPTNASHLHTQLIGKKPVIGGNQKEGILFVGRISESGETKIGKVPSFYTGRASIFYVGDNKEKQVNSYEVLLYNGPSFDVRIKNE